MSTDKRWLVTIRKVVFETLEVTAKDEHEAEAIAQAQGMVTNIRTDESEVVSCSQTMARPRNVREIRHGRARPKHDRWILLNGTEHYARRTRRRS